MTEDIFEPFCFNTLCHLWLYTVLLMRCTQIYTGFVGSQQVWQLQILFTSTLTVRVWKIVICMLLRHLDIAVY